MERTTIVKAKELFGSNFVGVEELNHLFCALKLDCTEIKIPEIKYSLDDLIKYSNEYILILGLSEFEKKTLSVKFFREAFGVNPDTFEPCFYNQDWYLNEKFINNTLENRWYLVKRNVITESRSMQPFDLLKQHINFPSAILCVYTFFAYYFAYKEILWKHDFIWCDDNDHNGDRIYVGKYYDVDGINKNGFSIHRHLTLRDFYGSINLVK